MKATMPAAAIQVGVIKLTWASSSHALSPALCCLQHLKLRTLLSYTRPPSLRTTRQTGFVSDPCKTVVFHLGFQVANPINTSPFAGPAELPSGTPTVDLYAFGIKVMPEFEFGLRGRGVQGANGGTEVECLRIESYGSVTHGSSSLVLISLAVFWLAL